MSSKLFNSALFAIVIAIMNVLCSIYDQNYSAMIAWFCTSLAWLVILNEEK